LKQDPIYDIKIILLNLFFLYKLRFPNEPKFDSVPDWFADLSSKYDKIRTTQNTNPFDLDPLTNELINNKSKILLR